MGIETVRCRVCKGTRRMFKLGGIEGECDRCNGKGYVEQETVKPEAVEAMEQPEAKEVIKQVAEVGDMPEDKPVTEKTVRKYRRKTQRKEQSK